MSITFIYYFCSMMNHPNITGIVLAGGKSRRMGVEKGLIRFGGKHLIEYAIEVLEKVCDRIIISENSKAYNFLGYEVIPDIYPNSGPMGGIYSALKSSKTDLNLVLSCDMPFISIELLNYLIEQSDNFEVAVPWYGEDKFEPMCAFYHKKVIPVLEEFIMQKNFKIPDAFKVLNTNMLRITPELSFYKNYLFDNLNSKEDLVKANQKLDEFLPKWENVLLIAGSGRNVGKTSLACDVIKKASQKSEVIGLKISPHIHTQHEKTKLILDNDHFSIYQELDPTTDKDSSRMLRAGANKVFYIQSEESYIGKAFQLLKNKLDEKIPIVCESGGLRNFIVPSVFLLCTKEGNTFKESHKLLIPKADKIVNFHNPGFDMEIAGIQFNGEVWEILD